MSASQSRPWTQEQFFAWAEAQNDRFEFDGFRPEAMTGGNANHNMIAQNLYSALRQRLRGSGCRAFGPDLGLATIGKAVRYPDALVTCSKVDGESRLAPDPVLVFEVLSSSSGRIDRIVKVREYLAVPSIRRYVIVESADVGLTVLEKQDGIWLHIALTGEDTLHLPEIGASIPVSELYEDVVFAAVPDQA
jgi:Uma2 family endonuclease